MLTTKLERLFTDEEQFEIIKYIFELGEWRIPPAERLIKALTKEEKTQ